MPTNPFTVQNNNQIGNWDYLASSLNLFGLSILFIVFSLVVGTLATGLDLWLWLTDQNNATET